MKFTLVLDVSCGFMKISALHFTCVQYLHAAHHPTIPRARMVRLVSQRPPDDGSRTPATWKDLWPRPETLVVAKLHLLQMAPVPRMTIIHQYPENLCVKKGMTIGKYWKYKTQTFKHAKDGN